ncbi:MAG: hypothetical protein HY913_21375 [Desulfomonile tiedjei]|nr:hypothetical protein [Desulfomonile tiedjei]
MERVMVSIVIVMVFLVGVVGSAQSMTPYPPQGACGPQRTMVTKMIPCMKTEMVAEVVPCTRVVPVKRIGYRMQNVMLKGMPVGQPCGLDPCIKCCPQPFCQVVQQKVPYEYYEPQTVRTYNVVYKPVCRPVMLPQNYLVEAIPMCR